MDTFEILREMHVDAKATFREIEQAAPDKRGALWAKLRPELVAHEQIEERFVYGPAVKDLGGRDPMLADWEQRHKDLVHQASALMDEIGHLDAKEPRFVDLVGQLHQALAQHIDQEETSAWPHIRQAWGQEKLDQASGKVQAAKKMAAGGAAASGLLGGVAESVKNAGDWAAGS